MFRSIIYLCLCACLLKQCEVNSKRILAVFAFPSISHQFVYRAYTNELIKQGHELVIVTTDPYFPKDRPKDNVTEIDISFSYNWIKNFAAEAKETNLAKRGAILELSSIIDAYITIADLCGEQFRFQEFKNILEDKNQHFDLIVIEVLMDCHLILSHIFKAPIIQFSTCYGTSESYEAMGAASRHPIFHPNYARADIGGTSWLEIIRGIYKEFRLIGKFKNIEARYDVISKEIFGPDTPTVDELRNNIDLLFVNTHPIFDGNRAVPPGVVYLGALQLQPAKEIPTELKEYLDNSKRGVIYVSLGTNVDPSLMDKDFFEAFVETFEALPYDILWKLNDDKVKLPPNVKTQKWFPQRALLMHPNVKLFVMQGGLQSTDEAIDATVPLVGIPFLGDQWFNVNKYVELGIGTKVDTFTMTSKDLLKAIHTVMDDKSYKRNIEKLKAIINDQPQTAMERAMWWTNYVLKYGGAKHLKSPAANISWRKYLLLDYLVPLALALLVGLILSVLIVIYSVRALLRLSNVNSKVKKS